MQFIVDGRLIGSPEAVQAAIDRLADAPGITILRKSVRPSRQDPTESLARLTIGIE